ncbi:hypothetical protein BCT84_02620 [Vibrio breoganii]|nr:hypothetical protein BCT84_02620 [Vibrio breoganii]
MKGSYWWLCNTDKGTYVLYPNNGKFYFDSQCLKECRFNNLTKVARMVRQDLKPEDINMSLQLSQQIAKLTSDKVSITKEKTATQRKLDFIRKQLEEIIGRH